MIRSERMRRECRRDPRNVRLAVVLGLVALCLVLFGVMIGRVSALF